MPSFFLEVGEDPFELNDCLDPCLATGLGGLIVPENLELIRICQDPDNIGILYMEISISGVFDYTPTMVMEYTDPTTGQQIIDVSSKLILNYKGQNLSLPLSTDCGTKNYILAWDVASLIPNWGNIQVANCTLTMSGEFVNHSFEQDLMDKLNEIFISENPEIEAELVKSSTPIPFALSFDTESGRFKIQYAGFDSEICRCDIACGAFTEDDTEINICGDQLAEFTFEQSGIVDDPMNVQLKFTDSIGNENVVNTQIIATSLPIKPGAFYKNNPDHVVVAPNFISVNSVQYDREKVQYQIWRYENHVDNLKLIADWSSKDWSTYYDRDVSSGSTYGYTVRFRGEFKDASEFSDWTVVSIP